MVSVAAFFELIVFTSWQVTPIDQITNNPAAWINKTVTLEGNLTVHPIPYTSHPWVGYWNYTLNSSSGWIGVRWNSTTDAYDNEEVFVYGIVSDVPGLFEFKGIHDYGIEALSISAR
jgi:hypothetical protein